MRPYLEFKPSIAAVVFSHLRLGTSSFSKISSCRSLERVMSDSVTPTYQSRFTQAEKPARLIRIARRQASVLEVDIKIATQGCVWGVENTMVQTLRG